MCVCVSAEVGDWLTDLLTDRLTTHTQIQLTGPVAHSLIHWVSARRLRLFRIIMVSDQMMDSLTHSLSHSLTHSLIHAFTELARNAAEVEAVPHHHGVAGSEAAHGKAVRRYEGQWRSGEIHTHTCACLHVVIHAIMHTCIHTHTLPPSQRCTHTHIHEGQP